METAKQFYILSMMVITAKKRYGNVKAEGIVRVLKAIKYLWKNN